MANWSSWQTATIADGAATSGVVDLKKPWTWGLFIVPALTGATITITVSNVTGGTYATLDKPEAGGAMALPESKASMVRLGGVQFLKVVANTAQSGAAAAILVRGSD